jgi:hypothetical protein
MAPSPRENYMFERINYGIELAENYGRMSALDPLFIIKKDLMIATRGLPFRLFDNLKMTTSDYYVREVTADDLKFAQQATDVMNSAYNTHGI